MKPIRGGLLLGVGVLVVALSSLAGTSWGAYPGGDGRIAYTGPSAPRTIHNDIFSVLPSGAALRQLTNGGIDHGEASWSPDGRRVAFTRSVLRGRYQVFTMLANGTHQRSLTHDKHIDATPGFSPNGRRVIYSNDNLPIAGQAHPRRVSIYSIRTDGTKRRLLVRGGYAVSPAYSPSGRRIVFAGSPRWTNQEGIWISRSDGSRPHRLTHPEIRERYDAAPDWAPDGRHIIFVRCPQPDDAAESCYGQIHVMRADGSHNHPLGVRGVGPVYSPEGKRIAFAAGAGGCGDIFTMSRAGSGLRAVTHFCDDPLSRLYATVPSWQPIPPG